MRFTHLLLISLVSFTISSCAMFNDNDDEVEEARAIYQSAKGSLLNKSYAAALEKYERLERNYPFSPFAQAALIETAYANYKSDDTETAAVLADQFIRNNPNHKHLDYAYYLKGLSYFNYGKTFLEALIPRDRTSKDVEPLTHSFDAFNYLYKNFPNSPYRDDVRRRLVVLRNMLAVHEIRVALFYFKKQSYVATVNRVNYMLERYDGAQHTPDGLSLLARAYEKLGSEDLADDTFRVLKLNYPEYVDRSLKRIAEIDQKQHRGWFAGLNDLADAILEKLRLKARY